MYKFDYYVVYFPGIKKDYVFYKSFRSRAAARQACIHLIKDIGYDHALIRCIADDHFSFEECSIIKEEVFL